jgi:hypothetical protein
MHHRSLRRGRSDLRIRGLNWWGLIRARTPRHLVWLKIGSDSEFSLADTVELKFFATIVLSATIVALPALPEFRQASLFRMTTFATLHLKGEDSSGFRFKCEAIGRYPIAGRMDRLLTNPGCGS